MEDEGKIPFSFVTTSKINKLLYKLDQITGYRNKDLSPLTSATIKDQYLMRNLIQEAITSSQLEGAATTREIAKDMIKSARAPRDQNEQMILNNFLTMEKILTWKDETLDLDLLLKIHTQITEDTFENASGIGRLRKENENVVVEDANNR